VTCHWLAQGEAKWLDSRPLLSACSNWSASAQVSNMAVVSNGFYHQSTQGHTPEKKEQTDVKYSVDTFAGPLF
jgi:hypothetical protein